MLCYILLITIYYINYGRVCFVYLCPTITSIPLDHEITCYTIASSAAAYIARYLLIVPSIERVIGRSACSLHASEYAIRETSCTLLALSVDRDNSGNLRFKMSFRFNNDAPL